MLAKLAAVTLLVALFPFPTATTTAAESTARDNTGATTTGADDGPGGPRADDGPSVEDRLLTVRPTVGPTWVVPIDSMTSGEQLLVRTLQGVVNRTQARLYLRDGSDQGAQRWLDTYTAEGLVTVEGTTDLAGALERFASEASGFVVADEAEPWTIHVATTIAAAEHALVAVPATVPLLEARGLTEIADVRGRWTDAASAYEDLVEEWADRLPHEGVAVLRPDDRLYDFTVQQGMLTLFTRPSDPQWGRIVALITDRPAGTPVFGYLSDTGDEEAIAVGTLANSGLVLVPTDTTRNLSFQVAVGGDRPRATLPPREVADVEQCAPEALNVVVALTDGDNINVPLNRFSGPTQWGSANRGDLPLGWSITPALAVLAPAAWDAYVREATDVDELVGMIGWAYGAPSLLPDVDAFYADSFALMDDVGMSSFWSLGGGLETPGTSGWRALDAAADATTSGTPHSVLVGYGGGSGTGRVLHSPAGRPGFTSGSAYLDTPADLASQLDDLLTRPAADRPLVSFLAATNWSNPAADLIATLRPYQDAGVRFLTPAEAAACLPPFEEPTGPEAGPGECLPTTTPEPHGLALISDATVADMASTPTRSPIAATVSAPSVVDAGDELTYHAEIVIDLPTLAAEVLEDRVRPIVTAGYGAELAAAAWVEMELSSLEVSFPSPDGTVAGASPAVITGPGTAGWGPSGEVRVTVSGPLLTDSRTAGASVEVEVTWSVVVDEGGGIDAHDTIDLSAVEEAFDLDLTVGVMLGDLPLTGGARAPWTCAPTTEALATTTVTPSTTTTTTTSTTTSTMTSTSTTQVSPSTTTATATTSEPVSSTTTAPGSGSLPPSPTAAAEATSDPRVVEAARPATPKPGIPHYTG